MGAKQQCVNEVTQNNCLKCWDGRLKEYIYRTCCSLQSYNFFCFSVIRVVTDFACNVIFCFSFLN